MKVLQLCGKDFYGAGRAAYRLHKGLLNAGIDSKMWVGAKRSGDPTVTDIHPSYFKKKLYKVWVNAEKLYIKLLGGRPQEMFSVGTIGHSIRTQILKEKPDVIHLHWVNRGFMNIKALKNLNIPIVISLHDMWWYTGGCHYDEECNQFKKECGKCPVLQSKKHKDLSYLHLKYKMELLSTIPHLAFVGLSYWMVNTVSASSIGKSNIVVHLPNGIETNVFSPSDKKQARLKLNLPANKKLVLFAAVDALSELRKGYKYINEALKNLSDDYELVVVGEKSNNESEGGLKAHYIGEIKSDELLIQYISAVDVAVVPSLQENLSNLIMESLACEVPVVAFSIGGNSDMIKHKENGFLAEKESVSELTEGIEYCCDEKNHARLSKNAREYIISNFELNKVTNEYIDLYHSMTNG